MRRVVRIEKGNISLAFVCASNYHRDEDNLKKEHTHVFRNITITWTIFMTGSPEVAYGTL